ncbi:MAG: hypothetical protein RR904_04850 [Bacilli bacterium]
MDIQNLIGSVSLSKYTEEQRRITILTWVAKNLKIRLKDYNISGAPTGYSRKLWGKGRGIEGRKNYMPDRVKEQIELNEMGIIEEDSFAIAEGIIEQSLIVMEDLLNAARNAKTSRVRNNYINAFNNKAFMVSTLELSIYLYAKDVIEKGYSIGHEYLTLRINGIEANRNKLNDIWKGYANEVYSLEEASVLTEGILTVYQDELNLNQKQLDTVAMEHLLLNLVNVSDLEGYLYALADEVASRITGKVRLFLP